MKVRNSPQAYAGIGIIGVMLASTLLSACPDRHTHSNTDGHTYAYSHQHTHSNTDGHDAGPDRHTHSNTDGHAYAYSHQHAHPYRHGNTCPDRYLGSKRVRGHA